MEHSPLWSGFRPVRGRRFRSDPNGCAAHVGVPNLTDVVITFDRCRLMVRLYRQRPSTLTIGYLESSQTDVCSATRMVKILYLWQHNQGSSRGLPTPLTAKSR